MPKKPNQKHAARVSLAPPNIGYRIDAETQRLLGERVASLEVSPHEWARHCLLTMLHEAEDRSEWQIAVSTLQIEIEELRKDIALATQALLVAAGNLPPEKAREWIGRNLKSQ